MPYYTDNDNNAFVGTSLINDWSNFVNNAPNAATSILLSRNKFEFKNWLTIGDATGAQYPVLAWTPDLPQETLTNNSVISTNDPWYYPYLIRGFVGEWYQSNYGYCPPRNARFTILVYRTEIVGDGTYNYDSIIQIPPSYLRFCTATDISMPTAAYWNSPYKHFLTIAKNEIHYFCADSNYTHAYLMSSGMLLNPTLPFSAIYDMNSCINRISFNQANNNLIYNKGYMPWLDWSCILNLTVNQGDYPLACSNGTTFGTDLMLTDYIIRSNNAQYNYPYRGKWKNLKIGIGSSIAVGRKYHCQIDNGSPKWLCLGKYNNTSDKYVMMRIYE